MMRLYLLALLPLAPLLKFVFHAPPLIQFSAAVAAVAILADWLRHATRELAQHTGPTIGGLLMVSLGSLAEFLLALFVLLEHQPQVVHAQIVGSIMATCLLGLGLAIAAGGLSHFRQGFRPARAGLLSSMLVLVVIALLLPATFDLAEHQIQATAIRLSDEQVSIAVSVLLLLLYCANMFFTLVTHRDIFETEECEKEKPRWSILAALSILAAVTAAIALESEIAASALGTTAEAIHLSPLFLGVIVLALIGTAGDLVSAVWFARADQMDVVMSICIGSAIQMALVIAPLLVLCSMFIGQPMTLVFSNPLDLFAIAGTAFIVNVVASDGETTWFEGALLIGIYLLLAIAYFYA